LNYIFIAESTVYL